MSNQAERAARETGRQAKRVADSRWFELTARAGYVGSGIVHLLIGYLAILLGVGNASSGSETDQSGALQAEVDMVLTWAEAAFGQAAPIDEGGEWDFDLTRSVDAANGEAADSVRHVVALSITGTPAFAEAFEAAFEAAE